MHVRTIVAKKMFLMKKKVIYTIIRYNFCKKNSKGTEKALPKSMGQNMNGTEQGTANKYIWNVLCTRNAINFSIVKNISNINTI